MWKEKQKERERKNYLTTNKKERKSVKREKGKRERKRIKAEETE